MAGILSWFAYMPLSEWLLETAEQHTALNGISQVLFPSAVYWATLLLVPVLVSSRDYLWKFYRRQFRPHPYHIIQELKHAAKKLEEDPIKPPIHTVFAEKSEKPYVSRGFTFSQTSGQNILLDAHSQSPKFFKRNLDA